jgi:ribosomal-protein-alanine N-acetyltransferase
LRLERSEYGPDAFSVHSVRMIPILHGRSCWVVGDDVLQGYCLAAREELDPKAAWILAVVVDKTARTSGIGSALVRSCVDGLSEQGVRDIKLTVEEDNTPAQRLYAAAGFDVRALRPQFFGADGDRIEMSLHLGA